MIFGSMTLSEGQMPPFSSLAPAHQHYLETGSVETDKSWVYFAVEKDASKPSIAATYWGQRVEAGRYAQIKKEILEWPLQSLIIEYSKHDSCIEVTRNHHAECALYLLAEGEVLHFHWDPVRLYPYLNRQKLLNVPVAVAALEMHSRYRAETVFHGMFSLPERGKAVFKNSNIEIIKPPAIELPEGMPLKEGVDPLEMFFELLQQSLARWPVQAEEAGAVLSSGLDTTIVANLLKARFPSSPLKSFGFWMMQEERDAVKAMRMETVDKLKLEDYYPKVEDSIGKDTFATSLYWPEQGLTDFADNNLAQRMAAVGVSLATTGIGGDELCVLSALDRKNLGLDRGAPDQWEGDAHETFNFLSPAIKPEVPLPDTFAWPNGYIGISAPSMASGVGLFYLRHGIWMAHPLASTELQMFARFLPSEWRYKRKLSREALGRLGYSTFFTNQIPKEDLSLTMETLMLQVDWDTIFREPLVCELGIVDRAMLQKGIEIFKQSQSVAVGIKLSQVLRLELGMKSVYATP